MVYFDHSHDWVASETAKPVALNFTYLQRFPDFELRHLEESVLGGDAWDADDPRTLPNASSMFCHECGYLQSNNVSLNECRCFPELYGNCKTPVSVQVFRTPGGKNNCRIARCVKILAV